MLNLGVNQQFYRKYEECPPPLKCNVTLKNGELWNKFHSLGTEMIITKSGRRMFPSLHVQVTDLSPSALYCVILEMTPTTHNRFKYSASGGWFPAGTEEAQSPHRVYLHPDSPARGDYWMSQPISFGRLKLTNTIAPPAGQVVLSSMHKYQPRIIISKAADPREMTWAPSHFVAFKETQFIAVTAYQNDKITKLKIDHNPFAKGFRETGQAKCKRKRIGKQDEHTCKEIKLEFSSPLKVEDDRVSIKEDDDISIKDEDIVCTKEEDCRLSPKKDEEDRLSISSSLFSPGFYSRSKSSLYSYHSKEERLSCSSLSPSISPMSSPDLFHKSKPSIYPYQTFSPYEYNNPLYPHPPRYLYSYRPYPTPYWGNNVSTFYSPLNCSTAYLQCSRASSEKEKIKEKPRKLTDFSIRKITGCN